MQNTAKISLALVAIITIVTGTFSYLYLSQPAPAVALSGSGATFPAPLLNAMITEYHGKKSNVQITYDAVGSSNGISALEAKAVDFACSDAPLSVSDRVKAPNALHIPETIGAVAVAYNLEGVSSGLHLTGAVLADIFMGNINKWNDPTIQNINPQIALPNHNITVVHRSDGSGTTFIFTKFLCTASSSWATDIGSGKTVTWPVGLGANGNSGLASVVQANAYTIGYIELAHVLQNNMTVAAIQNPLGNWIIPNLDSTQIAAQSSASSGLPAGNQDWAQVSLLNAQDPHAYPIVSFSYVLVYQELNVIPSMTFDKAKALVEFLWWMVNDGQQLAPDLSYVPLPTNVVQANKESILSITYNGQELI
ncbi:MAG: phosphate ABC transporter substrate-binding protein PstS [Candidatus Bathyarchaeota archaeon]|nr:phosphate ABC transporter substrate-binding protein PstS [Candidatus Bathyarchaeota archaeon]